MKEETLYRCNHAYQHDACALCSHAMPHRKHPDQCRGYCVARLALMACRKEKAK